MLSETLLRISERTKKLNLETYLFDNLTNDSPGIRMKEDESSILKFLDDTHKNRYYLFGLGKHNSWKKVQSLLRTERNGVISSFISTLSPSPRLNLFLLRNIGVNIEKPYLGNYEKGDLEVSVATHCTFDYFFPELISVGYGTHFGLQCIVATHANQIDYWAIGTVDIGRNVFIGARSIIGPGAIIGDNAKINVGSVVYDEVPEGRIFEGNPAKDKGQRKFRDVKIYKGIPKIES